MRPVLCMKIATLASILAGFGPTALMPPAHAAEGGYALLELDGYKVKWGERRLGAGARVSYAFAGEALRFDDARNCREVVAMDTLVVEHLPMETLAREAAAAFRVWERAAGLSFHKVDDAREADIILGAQGEPRGRALADVSSASSPEAGVRTIERALVCLNPNHKWKVGFDGDENVYDLRYTLVHEIGHAIGLDHPGPSGQVMAFRYTETFDDLQPGDLRGIRLLYGGTVDGDGLTHGFESDVPAKSTAASNADPAAVHTTKRSAKDEEIGVHDSVMMDRDGGVAARSANGNTW